MNWKPLTVLALALTGSACTTIPTVEPIPPMRVPDYLLSPCELPTQLDADTPRAALRVIAQNNHKATECRMMHDALRHTLLNRRENAVK